MPSWNKHHQKKNLWKNLNKSLYLSTRPLNITYWKSKQPDYNQNNMDGDPGTADVEPNDVESTSANVSQCTPRNCKFDKYKWECAEYKRIVHYGCNSLPTYQILQIFLTMDYRKFISCKCVEIPSYLHVISLNRHKAHLKTVIKNLEGELREKEERFTEVGNPDYDAFTKIEGSMKKHIIWNNLGETLQKNCLMS